MSGFHHEALLYSGQREFRDATVPFIREGLHGDEGILIAVSAPKIEMLRAELGEDADKVSFADMAELGRNPARIIPAWREFVTETAGHRRPMRGIGEPIWAERSAAELAECQRHESLVNLAFDDAPDFILICPYDTAELSAAVVRDAHRSHPVMRAGGARHDSPTFAAIDESTPFDEALSEPLQARQTEFALETLSQLRELVGRAATAAGLSDPRAGDLVSAVNEVATNSVRHAGGRGILRVWREADSLLCEVRDEGRIEQPLAGCVHPEADQMGGFGLWLANQLCDLVQIRSFPTGGVVRMHMRLD